MYLVIIFHLPNHAYYAQFVSMNSDHLKQTVLNVFSYAVVELVSLIVVQIFLSRFLRISPIRQLAFVLTHEYVHVHSVLMGWVLYSTQGSLAHYGMRPSCSFISRFIESWSFVFVRARLLFQVCVAFHGTDSLVSRFEVGQRWPQHENKI